VTLNFHISPIVFILPIFQSLSVFYALIHFTFYSGKPEEIVAAFMLLGILLLEIYAIQLDKIRILNSIVEFLGLIEGEI